MVPEASPGSDARLRRQCSHCRPDAIGAGNVAERDIHLPWVSISCIRIRYSREKRNRWGIFCCDCRAAHGVEWLLQQAQQAVPHPPVLGKRRLQAQARRSQDGGRECQSMQKTCYGSIWCDARHGTSAGLATTRSSLTEPSGPQCSVRLPQAMRIACSSIAGFSTLE